MNNRVFNNDKTNNQITSIVEFRHLTSLTIHFRRVIYAEQFLFDTNTHLPNLIDLTISYENLATVTQHFTRDSTRRNCSEVQTVSFTISTITVHPKDFYLYFPSLE